MEERIYTLPELSEMTGLSLRTLYRRIESGAIEGTKVKHELGQIWTFTPEQVDKFTHSCFGLNFKKVKLVDLVAMAR